MVVSLVLFMLGSLFVCGRVEARTEAADLLRDTALQLKGSLTCKDWDCNCAFNHQRGCCCAASDMSQIEEDTDKRTKELLHNIKMLNTKVQELTDGVKVSFKAVMDSSIASTIPGTTDSCFGPFNTNVPIPFRITHLNEGAGYNPSLGIFTAPHSGIYAFSFTIYSYVKAGDRIYHKVQLMMNGNMVASVWENNRDDGEDSATQFMMVKMKRGDQVYTELISGRKICNSLQHNIFTGYIVYTD